MRPASFPTRTLIGGGILLASLATLWMAGSYLPRSLPTQSLMNDPRVSPTAYAPSAQVPNAFEGAVDWINTAGPIRLEDLKGKVVLLDFWTYCCINCHHVLPDLDKLEKKYGNSLVVIGVHTAKFDAEKDTENIRKKVREYRIAHPVINDANQIIWTRFGVRAWPTLVLLDPQGDYVGYVSGEGHYDLLDRAIGKLTEESRKAGNLNETPLYFGAERDKPSPGPLLFPGKILADAKEKRLFISDTGHNRVIMTDLDGKALEVIGSGEAGHADGAYATARFNRQQGLCLVDDTLYVADTENHMIRAIDLKAKRVSTVAGTGKQGNLRLGGGPGPQTPLNSPWDLVRLPSTNTLAVAMAGPHQIWRFDLDRRTISHWAGSGLENSTDGDLQGSAFAQPSGLATDGRSVFIADSEASAVRALVIEKKQVETIVGTHDLPNGQSLFAFGDEDGKGMSARLQHCLGLAWGEGKLYVADTYNNKIKVCDVQAGSIQTLSGARAAGKTDGSLDQARFDQPGGLSLSGDILYVADTNNHAVRAIRLKTGTVETLELSGLEPPKPPQQPPSFPNPKVIQAEVTKVAPGDPKLSIDVDIELPDGFKVNPDAPMPILVETPNAPQALAASNRFGRVDPPADTFPVEVTLAKPSLPGDRLDLRLSISLFLCKEGAGGYCEIRSLICNLPVTFETGAGERGVLKANASISSR